MTLLVAGGSLHARARRAAADERLDDEPFEDEALGNEVYDDGLLESAHGAPEPIEFTIRGPRNSRRRANRLGTIECPVRPLRTPTRRSDQDPDPPPF